MLQDRNCVGVKFFNQGGALSNTYHYWTKSNDLKEGDLVVVKLRGVYIVAIVANTDLSPAEEALATKWIVGAVQDENMEESIRADRDVEALLKTLETRARKLKTLREYEQLAKEYKRMKKLLKKLRKHM
jgi:hypothetical protein